MKKLLLIIIMVISACALAACNNQVSSDKLLYRNWPETGKETFTYDISTAADGVLGTFTQSVENVEGGYLINISQADAAGNVITTGWVKFSNKGTSFIFPPIESFRQITAEDGSVTSQYIVYNGKNITYYYNTGDVPADVASITSLCEGVKYNIDSPYFDNMQFYTIIRGATFANNKFSLSFNLFVPEEKAVVKISCALGTSETMQYTVAGTDNSVACQAISIYRNQQITGEPIKAYYATENIAVGDKSVKQALVKFVNGAYTYSLTNITVE